MPAIARENNLLTYRGCNFLRQRLLLSTLSGKPIKIIDIRSTDDEPGLREFEINLIRLFDKITNGTKVELGETGTSLYYHPGILIGGQFVHECCTQRGIGIVIAYLLFSMYLEPYFTNYIYICLGYYLETLIALGPFCKEPINVTLRGITQSSNDVSVDKVKAAAFPILLKFILVDDGLSLKINKRGLFSYSTCLIYIVFICMLCLQIYSRSASLWWRRSSFYLSCKKITTSFTME